MNKWFAPITLENEHVRLSPLAKDHRDDLLKAASDGQLWELWYTSVPDESTIDSFIAKALEEYQEDVSCPFVVFDKKSSRIVGSTRYMNAVRVNRRLEIGHTWYAKSVHRTPVNASCKLLLLEYAFEQLNCIAVEFRTHWHNHQSRRAIARLGAKQDGVLRNHKIDKEGILRDTVVFSILNSEWESAKRGLQLRLSR